jgi:formamidopyrimidine-DNA glycosylase
VPELPEVEITARRLDAALAGVEVESARAPGMVALKSIDPPLSALAGRTVDRLGRVGKMPVVGFDGGEEPLALLVHLMSAGRLQIYDKRASLRDRTARVLIRLADGRELRLREFGTKQRAWAKLLRAGELESDEMVATLGPGRGRRSTSSPAGSTNPATFTRCCATSGWWRGSAAPGWTRSSGRRGCRRSSRGPSSTATRWSACT